MEVSTSAYALSAALVAIPLLVVLLLRRRRSDAPGSLRLPPGPPRLPIIGNLHQVARATAKLGRHRAMQQLSAKYGPLMFLQLGELRMVVASSDEAAKEVLKTHDLALASRPMTVTGRIFTREGLAVARAPYGEHWRQMRKICVLELLSAKRVRSFLSIREEEVGRLVQAIASSPAAVNLSKVVSQHINDIVVRAMVGRCLKDRDYFLERLLYGTSIFAGMTLADFFPSSRLAGLLSNAACRRVESFRQEMYSFMDGVIEDHQQQKTSEADGHEDLLDVVLRIQREGELHPPITQGDAKAQMLELFAAGSETTSTTIQWAMLELLRNPRVMEKAQSEVRHMVAANNMVGKKVISEQDIEKMHYVKQVIKETLRLHMPAPLLLPRECRQDGCQLLGFDVPKGTMVLVNAWAIARDPKLWVRPEAFEPERFEGSSLDFKGTDFEYTPFGGGRRVCPGMHFGLTNVEVTIANLLYHFDWEIPPGHELDSAESLGFIGRPKKHLIVMARTAVLPS